MRRTSTGSSSHGFHAGRWRRAAIGSAEERPRHHPEDDGDRKGGDDFVGVFLSLGTERIEPHGESIVPTVTSAPTNESDAVFETLDCRIDGPVATVTLDRQRRKNAATVRMWHELNQVLVDLGRDDAVRVVVLTGAGDAFCSGADIADGGGDGPPRHWTRRMEEVNDVCLALHALPQPTIARVNGVAAGAGANLALGCDLVVAADTATFSQIFAKRGLSVDFGGSWLLPRLVGLHKALELALLADMIDADEALRIGLINRVVPRVDLDAAVAEWTERLVASPPIALASIKRLIRFGAHSSLADALAAEGVAQSVNFTTADTVEAFAAFLEKRQPTFRGR